MRLSIAGRGSRQACCSVPVWWFFVRLLLGENPVSRFGKITNGGADVDGVAFAALNALVQVSDVLLPRLGMMALADDGVSRLDECLF